MPVFQLSKEMVFPNPALANADGLLAVGGDLHVARLLLAYEKGIFPWFDDKSPILWWSPPRRCVIEPGQFHVSRSLQRVVRQKRFRITFDLAFDRVIGACAETRIDQGQGTWITPEMRSAYCALHEAGFAHSAEAWDDDLLVGGIYGVSLGRAFFGESMFKRATNASKVAFYELTKRLQEWRFDFIDCQITNPHLTRLGAYEISRKSFLDRLERALQFRTIAGPW